MLRKPTVAKSGWLYVTDMGLQYGAYHHNPVNVAIHMTCVPLILAASLTLVSIIYPTLDARCLQSSIGYPQPYNNSSTFLAHHPQLSPQCRQYRSDLVQRLLHPPRAGRWFDTPTAHHRLDRIFKSPHHYIPVGYNHRRYCRRDRLLDRSIYWTWRI